MKNVLYREKRFLLQDSSEDKQSSESLPRPQFEARETLQAWQVRKNVFDFLAMKLQSKVFSVSQEKNHPWLELSDVHIETTEDIKAE